MEQQQEQIQVRFKMLDDVFHNVIIALEREDSQAQGVCPRVTINSMEKFILDSKYSLTLKLGDRSTGLGSAM